MSRTIGVVALLLVTAAPASANFCAQDAVPAATLLFPYVEVALATDGMPDPGGQTTISQVTNVGRESIIVHFTVWDVAGVPRFGFDEILSGYDSLQINWRDFVSGRFDLFDTSRSDFTTALPLTRDPFEWGPDGRSQEGGLTTPDNRSVITASQCGGPPPLGNRSDLGATIVSSLRGSQIARSHLSCGTSALRTDMWSFSWGLDASRVFFYVTADVVANCTTLFPTQAAYWSGVARNVNVLTGHLVFLNPRGNASEMVPAVHIEAAAAAENGGPSVIGFYEEKNGGVETNREPLATAFMLPYANDPAAGITSNLTMWKNLTELDITDNPATLSWGSVSDCGSYLYYMWDMDERSLSRGYPITDGGSWYAIDPNQFAFATQKVPLTNQYFDIPGNYGWLLLVLPTSYGGAFADPTPDQLGYLTGPYMGWAAVQLNYGTYSAGAEAITMGNALCFPGQTLPALGANSGAEAIR